ncbi:TauD/TfdA family dioxygenase [Shigella flexneri]
MPVLRHQVVFLRNQLLRRSSNARWPSVLANCISPCYPHAEGVDEIIVLDTHNDNPDNDNWHTDVTFIKTPPGAIIGS